MSTILKALDRHNLDASLTEQRGALVLSSGMHSPSTATRRTKWFVAVLLIGNLIFGGLYWLSRESDTTASSPPAPKVLLSEPEQSDTPVAHVVSAPEKADKGAVVPDKTHFAAKIVGNQTKILLSGPEQSDTPVAGVVPASEKVGKGAIMPDKMHFTAKIVGIQIRCQFEAIKVNGERIVARLADLACGDETSSVGLEAKRTMTRMIFTRHFEIRLRERDEHGMWLAELVLEDGTTLNNYLVANGLARRLDNQLIGQEVTVK